MRRIATLLLLTLFFLPAMARRSRENTMSLRDSIVEEASHHLGKRYQYAGKGPKRFDCSGFTSYVFRQFGYELSTSSASQYLQGKKRSLSDVQKGDLIFFKGSNAKSKGVGHVGIVYEVFPDGKNTTLKFIHASISSGVTIDEYPSADYYRIRFIGLKNVINETERREQEEEQQQEEETPQEEVPSLNDQQEGEEIITEEEMTPEKREISPYTATYDTIRHIVKKKETLFKISRKNNCTVEELMAWNGLKDTYLTLGQTLIILKENPNKETPKPIVKPDKEEKGNDSGNVILHTVKAKETLYRLSKEYDCSVDDIKRWNHLEDNSLKIGQTIIIKKSED